MKAPRKKYDRKKRVDSTFAVGAKCGSQVIDVCLGERSVQTKLALRTELHFACHCERCGFASEKSRSALIVAISRKATTCNHCAGLSGEQCAHGVEPVAMEPTKICGRCYDLPHRRPVKGPCRCGEHYEAEVLHVEQFASNGISNLGWAAIQHRRHITGGDDGRRGAQHRGPYRAALEFSEMT